MSVRGGSLCGFSWSRDTGGYVLLLVVLMMADGRVWRLAGELGAGSCGHGMVMQW